MGEIYWRDLAPDDLTPHEREALLEAARLLENAQRHVKGRMNTVTVAHNGNRELATEYALTYFRNLYGIDGVAHVTDTEVTVTPKE